MTYYIILFAFCVLMLIISSLVKRKGTKKIISIITLGLLCIISGTRYNVGGTDYFVYKNFYDEQRTDISIFEANSVDNIYGMEHGFLCLVYIVKSLGFSYYGFTLINSIIFYTLFYFVFKRYDYNINFIIILFLYKMFFYNTFVSLRQSIAIVIFWLSLPYLKEKKYIKYYIICSIALLFHRASIILFLVPFITNINLSKKGLLSCLILGIMSFILIKFKIINFDTILQKILPVIFKNDTFALNRLNKYLNPTYGMSIFYLLEYYLISLFLYIYYDKIKALDKNSNFFIMIFMCLLPLYTIFSSFGIVTRLKDFFFIAYPVIITYIAKCLKKNAVWIYLLTILICLYGYIRYIISFDDGSLLNYTSYLFNNVSIFLN